MNRTAPKRLTRVHVDASLESGRLIELPAETGAHLAKVLRVRSGEEIVLFSGDGREYLGSVESVRGSKVTAAVGRGAAIDRESPLALTLVQCVPRGDRMDFIVQKATELGVTRIVPVLSQRSVVRLDAEQAESKAKHWRAVAINACEQCGRNRLPTIEAPVQLINHLGLEPTPGQRLVLEPGLGNAAPEASPSPPPTAVEIAVGPEGGFAADELEAFALAGFLAVTLGPRILRTETAAIAALCWLQTLYGDIRRDL